jgi:spore maturation protein CgeB
MAFKRSKNFDRFNRSLFRTVELKDRFSGRFLIFITNKVKDIQIKLIVKYRETPFYIEKKSFYHMK